MTTHKEQSFNYASKQNVHCVRSAEGSNGEGEVHSELPKRGVYVYAYVYVYVYVQGGREGGCCPTCSLLNNRWGVNALVPQQVGMNH